MTGDQRVITLEDVKRLHLNPGDTLVLTVEYHMSNESTARLRNELRMAFPDNQVVILAPGMSFQVVSP